MGFLEAVKTCLFRKYADFRGRASRAEYWWFLLFEVVVTMAVPVWYGPRLFDFPAMLFEPVIAATVIGAALVVPHVAVTVRRFHDTDRSGWWALLYLVDWIPGVGWWIGLITTLVLLWFLIQKGDAGENRYGPNPNPDSMLGLTGSPPRTEA